MGLSLVLRRANLAFLAAGLVAVVMPFSSAADEIGAAGAAGGFAIHGVEETLRDFCSRDAEGKLWLGIPGGARFELVTSTSDPAIINPGDGAFHPFDEAEVRSALAQVRYPLGSIRADVFILPYPRRLGLVSAAGRGVILLSPGVRPLSRTQQHAEFVHELGHVVQYALMPDAQVAGWEAYRRLRGIQDASLYSATGAHADRPHEIFAEDFRALFGDALANHSGAIENPQLEPPGQVPGLEQFFVALASAHQPASELTGLTASPNPARGSLSLSRAGGTAGLLDVFDAAGRRLVTLDPVELAGRVEWRWDGRDRTGHPLGTAVVFARVRGAAGSAVRVVLLP